METQSKKLVIHARAAFGVIVFPLVWILSAWVFIELGRDMVIRGWWAGLFRAFQVFYLVVLASTALGIWHRHGNRYFTRFPLARIVYMSSSIAIFITCFILHNHDVRSSLIPMIHTANLLMFATLLGTLLSRAVNRVPEIVVVCIGLSMADMFSIIKGPTQGFVQELTTYYQEGMVGKTPLVDWLLIKIPHPGIDIFQPLFGISDWIAIVLLSASAVKLAIPDNLLGSRMKIAGKTSVYLPVAAAGLLAAVIIADRLDRFIPALPLICAGQGLFLLINCPASWALSPSDRKLVAGYTITFAGLFALMHAIA